MECSLTEGMEKFDVPELLRKFNNFNLTYHDIVKVFAKVVPSLYLPSSTKISAGLRDEAAQKYLFTPLEDFICNYDADDLVKYLTATEDAPPMCGRLFKIGEPTYHCKQCAMDPTCVLCVECFMNSTHRFHKYKMRTSGGGGCCDCGDKEAWKDFVCCEMHRGNENIGRKVLPAGVLERANFIFSQVLCYASTLLTNPSLTLPIYLQEELEEPFPGFSPQPADYYCTVLYNDEMHTFEQVISTLSRVIKCSQKDAVEYVTNIDREGRAVVKCDTFKVCCELKSDIEKYTSRHGAKALKVLVVHGRMIAHQTFALKILIWLQKLLKPSVKLRKVFAEVVAKNEMTDINSDEGVDFYTYLEGIFIHDTCLWKSARLEFHRLFITGMLMDYDNKKEFANAFVKRYRAIMNYFVDDDHEHSFSVVSLSVQIFTVPTIALYLLEEKDIFFKIVCTFMSECNAKTTSRGKLAFERHAPNSKFKRAIYALCDVRYLLTYVPDKFTDSLRMGFLSGYRELLSLLNRMEGMDSVVRQVGQHMEFEAEWESAFNLHIKLSPIIKLILKWCASDKELFYQAFRILTLKFKCEGRNIRPMDYVDVTVGPFTERVIEYNVSCKPVSIHLPLTRLFAGLSIYLEKFGIDYIEMLSNVYDDNGVIYKFDPLTLVEYVFRTRVMISQVHAGMWRRNGYSLSNQIYFYNNVKCRGEMLDRDIILLQLGATLESPQLYLMSLINKFNLTAWTSPDFEKVVTPNMEEDVLRQMVQLVEEFLLLIINIVGERYVPGVGKVSEEDSLKHEIVQQLCIQPMSHSELEKALPDDIEFELEDIIKSVAEFKRPSQIAAKCSYELKPKFAETYNVFFYHYTREELSKSEENQRKLNKSTIGLECCPPPKLPPFSDTFSKVCGLLTCDLLLYVMKIILERSLDFEARSFSEHQVHRVLHLIGTALNDEELGYLSEGFASKASSPIYNFPNILEQLLDNPRVEAHKDLIKWTLRKFMLVTKKENARNFVLEDTTAKNEEKETRSRLAAERKAKIMAQLAAAQKNFMKDNAHFFEEPMTLGDSSGEDISVPGPSACVALGSDHFTESASEAHICILCQERQEVTADGRALVYAAFVQRSTVLSKTHGIVQYIKTEDIYNMFLSPNIGPGLHTSTCGHVMHRSCWRGWYDNIINKESRRPYRVRQPLSYDVEKDEYLCPLCERLSNTIIPVLPKLTKFINLNDIPLKKASFETWKDLMLTAIRSSRKHKDGGFVYCQTQNCNTKVSGDQNAASSAQASSVSKSSISASAGAGNEPSPNSSDSAFGVDDVEMAAVSTVSESASTSTQPLPLPSVAVATTETPAFEVKDNPSESGTDGNRERVDEDEVVALLSNDIYEMMLFFSQYVYTIRFNQIPNDFYPMIPLVVWQSCAYTIHSVEQYLRMNDKPLFGDFSSRQTSSLEAIVRLSGVIGAAWKDSIVINQHASQLLEIVLDNNDELPGILDWDSFGLLVSLICSHTSMYHTGLMTVPTGTKLDLFVFQTMFYSMILQVISAMEFPDQCETTEPTDVVSPATGCLIGFIRTLYPNAYLDSDAIWNHIKTETLPFLRCSALFFSYLTDVPPPDVLMRTEGCTFENLCSYLGVSSSCSDLLNNGVFSSLLSTWTSKLVSVWPSLHPKQRLFKKLSTTKFLVELPEDYTELINTVSLFTCPNSDREDSRYPTLCLVCGEMLCSQTYCCQIELNRTLVGACNFHTYKCGAGMGVFLRIRECEILLLASPHRGALMPPPYLDEFGEPDPGLNRGNPLKLCQERYKRLQVAWLTHSIYEEIARAIESAKGPLNIQWQHF